jgi:ATP-dependent DNA helicase RecQ
LEEARQVLQRFWGHASFRPGQGEVVEQVLRRNDVLAVLPTGGGKSVCYQVPAVVLGGLTVVVSPLIALMEDQVSGLRARGVKATFINSQVPFREAEQRWLDAEHGLYRLLYLAPERFDTEAFRARAPRLPIDLLAVDEAHCISEWGPDFRPAYRRLAEAAEVMGNPPVIAVTATATPEVRRDIIEQLAMRQPGVFVRGFDRPNITPSVFNTSAKEEKLVEVLEAVPGAAIVYVATRKGSEQWAARLARRGISAEAYHGGLPAGRRLAVQERWQRDATRVIAATNAFGMGIDKADVRLVVHVDLPASLEAYYQEAGRAGRDGARAFSVLLFANADVHDARAFAEDARPEPAAVQAVYDCALSIAQIAIGSGADGPFVLDGDQVARITGLSPMAVRAAADTLVRAGVWEEARLAHDRGLIRFRQTADDVRRYADGLTNRALAGFIRGLLRTVQAGAFHDWVDMDLRVLVARLGMPPERVLRGLDFLATHDLLAYHPPGESRRYRLLEPRTQQVQLNRSSIVRARRNAMHRLAVVERYARSITCRRHFLLAYFGEPSPEHCGSCDICLGRHRPPVVTPEDEPHLRALLAHLGAGGSLDEWPAPAGAAPHAALGWADWLAHEGHIRPIDPLAGTFALTASGERFVEA